MRKIFLYLKNFDWILFFSTLLLMIFGLAEIYSIALSKGEAGLSSFKRQIAFVVFGIIMLFLLSFWDYYNLRSLSNYLYVAGVVVLICVLIFGKTVRGTTGWFDFGGLSIQPVEFMKFVLIVYLAKYFSVNLIKVSQLKYMFFSWLAVLIPAVLVIKQPDFGSALLLFFVWTAMIFFAGFKKRYILLIILMIFMLFASGWLFFFEDYQKQRLSTFFNPTQSSLDQGYNVTQAVIAVGSGGIVGRGIGFGSQSQLKFLPESQNDFIFAAVAEELGFFGVFLIISFFSVFFYRLLSSVKHINNDFGIYFILGFSSLIFMEMFINIGMNMGIMPIVGISLPFMSYGGSAIVSSLIMVGVVENIIIKSKIKY
ncbi:MAG: rod shape-determining protein RodA [bacterium]